jgi:simple sugar transport system substrate-binding protein
MTGVRLALGGVLAGAVAVIVLSCGNNAPKPTQTTPPTYYFVTHGDPTNPFWATVRKGMSDAATKYGVKTVFTGSPSGETAAYEASLVAQAIDAGANGIAVTIADVDAERDAINQAVSDGIPVIAINIPEIPPDGGARTINYNFYIGQNDLVAGVGAAKHAMQLLSAQGKTITRALCIEADPAAWATFRCEGAHQGLPANVAYDEVTLSQYATGADPTPVLDAYFNDPTHADVGYVQMTAPPTVPYIVGKYNLNSNHALLSSFDLDATTMADINDGTLQFTVDQQPYLQGYLPVMSFVLQSSLLLAPNDILTGPFFVDSSNIQRIQTLVTEGYR